MQQIQIDPNTILHYELTAAEADTVMKGLCELPAKFSHGIILKMQAQATAQLEKKLTPDAPELSKLAKGLLDRIDAPASNEQKEGEQAPQETAA